MDYDFHHPEDVLIETTGHAKAPGGWRIIHVQVLAPGNTKGVASYELAEGGLLHYSLKDVLLPLEPGIWVVEGVRADPTYQVAWSHDHEIRLIYQRVREPTEDEIRLIL